MLRIRLQSLFLVLLGSFFLLGCDGKVPADVDANTTAGNDGNTTTVEDTRSMNYGIELYADQLDYAQYRLPPLSQEDFDQLSETQKYKVALKLYGTFYYGVSETELSRTVHSGAFIDQTRARFDRPNSEEMLSTLEETVARYRGEYEAGTIAPMLARLYHMQPGKAYLNRWAAYVLTQTILFSPAYELDTVYTVDAMSVYSSLVRSFDEGQSMPWVTFTHMMTDENWRRFRSPEDNGREMLEIYNMDFDDAHVPLAATALKNWHLDRRSRTLLVSLDDNRKPIRDLFAGKTIKNGTDFYAAIVSNPNFVRTVVTRLVDIYFPAFSSSRKKQTIDQLVASHPRTWVGLLKQIVYSKAYLLDSAKPKSFEEAFYPIAKSLDWHPHYNSFRDLYTNLNRMHQATMRYKLGRKSEVPLDTQSFAWFHKTLRESVMTRYESPEHSDFDSWGAGWPLMELFRDLGSDLESEDASENDRVAYIVTTLFRTTIGRKPNATELRFFQDLIDADKYNEHNYHNFRWWNMGTNEDHDDDIKERGYLAGVVLDYLSRLSDTYLFDSIK